MLTLENDHIKISVKPLGAELCSLYHKKNQLEYLWQAGEAWAKHAPVLFPIVGQLKENKYYYNGKEYTLPRHGFAREKNFALIEQGPNRLTFRLKEDDSTLNNYPFPFIFEIEYALQEDKLVITYIVENPGEEKLYFSVGAHPAFKVPLKKEESFEDYSLNFDKKVNAERWPLENNLIAAKGNDFLKDEINLPMHRDLFKEDAIVFKGFNANEITLKSKNHNHGLSFELNNCPYLGLWAAKGGDFVCIEPWFGIADDVNSTQQLHEKEGINLLDPGADFTYSYSIRIF